MKYDPQNHNRRSIRLPGYDYTQPGAYFITLVTDHRACLFGEIVDGEMRLNDAGKIVQQEWLRLGQRFPYVQLDGFAILPNHLHAILVINASPVPVRATHPGQTGHISGVDHAPTDAMSGNDGSPLQPGIVGSPPTPVRATRPGQTGHISGVDHAPAEAMSGHDGSPLPNGPVPGSLGAIVGQFKSRVTKRLWSRPGWSEVPVWQRNYYEHIIRADDEHDRIRRYIESNPLNWKIDNENPERLR